MNLRPNHGGGGEGNWPESRNDGPILNRGEPSDGS